MLTRAEDHLRWACAKLETCLRTGRSCRSEDFFLQCPELAAEPDMALDLIYTEYIVRAEVGPPPPRDDFLRRFPHLAEALARQFAIHDTLHAAVPARPGAFTEPPDKVAYWNQLEIFQEVGRGSTAAVYKVWQKNLRRIVALKLFRSSPEGTPRAFGIEAEALGRLAHGNIVQIFESGTWEENPFLVLEYLGGGDLAKRWGKVPQETKAAAALVECLAQALHHAHERGVIHRDLRPGNILYTRDGVPKVVDFGLARLSDRDCEAPGRVVGTPSYMAPEQAAGNSAQAGAAADVYSLGAILYEALTGQPPFQGATVQETLHQVQTLQPQPPGMFAPVPPELESICLRCLQKDPKERYASALALGEDLNRFQQKA